MGLTSLQVCMDSSDWLQGGGGAQEESSGMEMEESSASPLSPSEMLACSRGPLSMERRLRPPQDQLALKCPRCESTHTKFCYYNNYSLSQPRYFCKTCRRYWTKGGTLRNIPVGGGCRKNTKKASSSSSSPSTSSKSKHNDSNNIAAVGPTADLQLSFPDQVQFSHRHPGGLIGHHHHPHPHHVPNSNPNNFLPIEFLESKLEGIVGNSLHRVNGNFDFMGSGASGGGGVDLGMINLGNDTTNNQGLLFMDHNSNFHNTNICAPFGMSLLEAGPTNNGGGFSDTCQRLMLPYEGQGGGAGGSGVDVKPSVKSLLSLEWQQEQQGCSNHDHHVGNYLNGLGSWPGVINNYGPSTTNSLV